MQDNNKKELKWTRGAKSSLPHFGLFNFSFNDFSPHHSDNSLTLSPFSFCNTRTTLQVEGFDGFLLAATVEEKKSLSCEVKRSSLTVLGTKEL
ncbi:hypothetical protein NL676_003421 [Syzygium grande]|nr:hypothetical protein NL676_003421 [Syzygium grande]